MSRDRKITEEQAGNYADQRKKYNSDKSLVQIRKKTHEKLKAYCKENDIKIIDYLEDLIGKDIS
jgi:hypothetical protein